MVDASQQNGRRPGVNLTQPSGYRAFISNSLPPYPPVQANGTLQSLLSHVDFAVVRPDGAKATLPNSDLFVFWYVRTEAVLASQNEGTRSVLQNLRAAAVRPLDAHPLRAVNDVGNDVRAMNYGLEGVPTVPVALHLIKDIHVKLMRGAGTSKLPPGEPRTSQNWAGPAAAARGGVVGCLRRTPLAPRLRPSPWRRSPTWSLAQRPLVLPGLDAPPAHGPSLPNGPVADPKTGFIPAPSPLHASNCSSGPLRHDEHRQHGRPPAIMVTTFAQRTV